MYRLVLSALLLTTAAWANSPADAVATAYVDLKSLPEQDRQYIRYHSLYAIPEKDRVNFLKVYAFQVNSLSRRATMRRVNVPPTVDDVSRLITPDLIRIDIREFKWNTKNYDKLADADPYFHLVVVTEEVKIISEDWKGGKWPGDGKDYPAGSFKVERKVKTPTKKTLTATSPWLPTDKMSYLVEQTQSKTPILRADWFLVQTGINKDRVAGYYSFLELTKREDFEKLTGLNVKEAQRIEREIASIVLKSGVSIRNRQIYRFGAIDAGYWQTRDVFKNQTKERNAVNSLNGDYKHDAEEHYGYLPNRLFAYYLSDQNGVQQDSAPDEVGPDLSSTSNDYKIHIFKSCVTCHKEGLRPIKDYGRQLFRGSTKLASYDKDKFERLQQLYLLPLERWYNRDVKDFSDALAELNGIDWTPTKNSSEYSRFWKAWAEDDVTPEIAARELGGGVTAKLLIDSLTKYASPVDKGGYGQLVPNVLLAFMQRDEKGVPAPLPMLREHWEEVYSLCQYVVRGGIAKP